MPLDAKDLQNMEKGAEALKAALETVNEVKTKVGGLEAADADFKQKIDKMGAQVATAIEELDKAKAADKVREEKLHELEISIARNPNAKAADVDKSIELQHEAMEMFIRKGSMRKNSSEQINFSTFVDQFCEAKKVELKDILGAGIETKSGSSLRVGSDVDGGFLVLPEFGGVIQTQIFETSPIRGYANAETIATDAYEFVDDYDQVTSNWVGETTSRTTTGTPQVGKRVIPVHEQDALAQATQKMLDDGIVNIESWLTAKISDKFARTENLAFVSGTGETQPRGFLSYATQTSTAYTPGKLQYVASGSTTALSYTGLSNLVGALKFDYFANAAFFTSRQTLPALLQILDGINRPIFNLVFDKNTRTFGNMMGLPLAIFNDMPVIASNAYPIAVGDMSKAYTIVDRRGINLLRDPYSNKPYVQFYATKRVGGDMVNWEALKLQKMSTS